MGIYSVHTTWSGYCRGESTYEVEADSEEKADDLYYEGERVSHRIIRDDTESEIESIKLKEEN